MPSKDPSKDQTIREKVEQFLTEKNYFTDGLVFVEGKTGINRMYLLAGCVAFVAMYLVVGYASALVTSLLGFAYPAYASVKAVDSDDKDDDTQWLTYWVVYACFGILEFFSDFFLGWFPLYFLFKCAFLCWCMAPFSWNGADFIYKRFIAPFIKAYADDIGEFIEEATEGVGAFVSEAEKQAKDFAIDAMAENMKSEHDKDE